MQLRRIFPRIIALLVSVSVGLFIAEGIVRVIAPQSVAVPWQDEINGINCARPNVHGRHAIPNTFDVTISFNSQRFRNLKDFQPEPDQGVFRIAVLGDSFTFGYGANNNETYPAQLERILQEQLKENSQPPTIEVMNAGNGGTGTGEQALWYDIWVKQFHPQVVVLTVVSNDVDDDLARRLFYFDEGRNASPHSSEELRAADQTIRSSRHFVNRIPGYNFLAQHSQLFGLIRNAGSAFVARKRKAPITPGAMKSNMNGLEDLFWKEGLPMMASEVGWLNKRARESGTQLAVVFVPSRESIYESSAPWADDVRWKSEAIVKVLKEACLKDDVPFSDLTPEIRERAEQKERPLYYDGLDTHPNPDGYRAIGENIARFLVNSGVLHESAAEKITR